MECSVFVPSHITGFFQIIENFDPLKKGSKGAGVVMDKGVITHVKTSKIENKINITINGKKDNYNDLITRKTVELLKDTYFFDSGLKIEHEIQVPIGCGFGTSASCALGVALGVSQLLKLPLSFNQIAAVAHHAEVSLGTGLGDLIAETSGGIVMRLKEGPPGFGKINHVISKPLYVISKTLGEMDTSSIIQDPEHQKKINITGSGMLDKLLMDPRPERFMQLSYEFAKETSLISEEVKELVDFLNFETLGASMAMLGNTAFALSEIPETDLEDAIISRIDFCGCKFIEN